MSTLNLTLKRNTAVSVLTSFLKSIIMNNDTQIQEMKTEIEHYRMVLEYVSDSDDPHHRIKQVAKTALLRKYK